MADPVRLIEPIHGRGGLSRVLPFQDSSSVRTQRQPTDTQPIEEAKESRNAGGGDTRGGGAERTGRAPLPRDQADVGGGVTSTRIQYSYDEDAGIIQTRIIESGTDRVIREIPSDKIVELAKSMRAYQEAGRNSLAGRRQSDTSTQSVAGNSMPMAE